MHGLGIRCFHSFVKGYDGKAESPKNKPRELAMSAMSMMILYDVARMFCVSRFDSTIFKT